MSAYLENLQWRYAAKKFDASKKLSQEQLDPLLDALRLSASSFGLQPYAFLVITDPALRAELRKAAWDQPQITDASHLIVLCAKTNVDVAYVDRFADLIAKEQDVPPESLKTYRDQMAGFVKGMPKPALTEWAKKQAYIALGFLLSAAAQMRVDSCPMEGFDPAQFDKVLNLADQGLASTVLCPVGFRAEDDPYAAKKKVRFPKEELCKFL